MKWVALLKFLLDNKEFIMELWTLIQELIDKKQFPELITEPDPARYPTIVASGQWSDAVAAVKELVA